MWKRGVATPASLMAGEGVGAPHAPVRATKYSNHLFEIFGLRRAAGSRPDGLRTLGRLGLHGILVCSCSPGVHFIYISLAFPAFSGSVLNHRFLLPGSLYLVITLESPEYS